MRARKYEEVLWPNLRKREDYAEPMASHHTNCEDYALRGEPMLPLPLFHDNILPQLAARPTTAAVEEGET